MSDLTTSPIGLFSRLTRSDCPESPRAWVMVAAAICLMIVLTFIGVATGIRILNGCDPGTGTRWVFGFSVGTLVLLAGFNIVKDPSPPKEKP